MPETSIKKQGTIGVLLAGTFLAVLNQTLLTPALPTIMRNLNVDATTVQWLTSGYSLVEAVIIPLAAFFMGRFSTRKLFMGGLGIFAVGSLLSAIAPNFGMLLLGRLLQATCTGLLLPMATSLILLSFSKEKRGSAMGLVGLIVGFAPAIGPVVSGLLVDGIGWRMLFVIVAVLAVLVIACGAKMLVNYEGFPASPLDIPSVMLSSVGMVCFLYGLSTFASAENAAVSLVLLIVGVTLVAVFVKRQLSLERPMLRVDILKAHDYRVAVIVVALIQAGFLGMQVILPLYIQGGRGYSATMSGLALLPGALCGALAAMFAGKLFDRHGIRLVAIVGGIVALFGAAGIVLFDVDTLFLFICGTYLVLSVGLQMVMTPMNTWGVNALDNDVVQHAQSLSNTFNQVAGSFGTALLVSLAALGSASAPTDMSVLESTFRGYHVAFCASAVLFVAFFLLALFATRKCSKDGSAVAAMQPCLDDVMKHDVYSVKADDSVFDAVRCMVDHETSGVPVVDEGGRAVGFVSDGDIIRALVGNSEKQVTMYYLYSSWTQGDRFDERMNDMRKTKAMDIATRKVIAIDASTGFDEACRALSGTKIKKVPVTDEGKVVGVISRADLMRYLVKTRMDDRQTHTGQSAVSQ